MGWRINKKCFPANRIMYYTKWVSSLVILTTCQRHVDVNEKNLECNVEKKFFKNKHFDFSMVSKHVASILVSNVIVQRYAYIL